MNASKDEKDSSALRRHSSTILLIVTNIFSIGCLYWVLRGAELNNLRAELRTINWFWVTVAVISDILVYFWHGWRWSLLLTPLAKVPFLKSVRAIYVGLFANEILPFRTGEVIRCVLLSRWTELPLSVTLSSALIERIFDGLWLVVCLAITIRFRPELPGYIKDGGIVLAAFVLICGALLAVAMFYKQQSMHIFSKNRFLAKLNVLIEDLHIIGHSKYLYFSCFTSLPYLLMQIVPIYALAKGYPGFDLSIGQAATMMVILRLGSVVPQAPGNVGTFQALTVVGLELFGVTGGVAKRFSLVMWSVITLPLLVAGFIALAVTGIKMGELRHHAHNSMNTPPKSST
ncbi:MAG: lysylphosphatidylglycerol synthase transmembrane domain-containing protein [Bryobacteraceae bacterium]